MSDYLDLPGGTSVWLNEIPIPYNSPVFVQPSDTNKLRIVNVEGCVDRVIDFVSDNCPTPNSTHFFIPNAFSPDGDGINDLFKPISAFELEFYELTIVDRLGSVVFQTDQIESGWNGGGHESSEYFLPNSLFNYMIKYKLPSELDYRELRGSFVIIR
jgi:gliding motility-associated-like protein